MEQIIIGAPSFTDYSGILASLFVQQWRQTSSPRSGITEAVEGILACGSQHEDIEHEFNELARQWKAERRATSFSSAMAMQPAYQRIIGLGRRALPLILRELEKELDHWFWALKAISGEDPVPPQSRGKMREMRNAWLKWGREKGYAR